MVCKVCKAWAATTEEQWNRRQANMIDTKGEFYACRTCGQFDWATTKDFIIIYDKPPQQRWHSFWRALWP